MNNLALHDIAFAYRGPGLMRTRRRSVLAELSWEIAAGRTVLLGPNGAGKSTLLALGATALRPDRGRVTLGDFDAATRHGRSQMRQAIGWMPQHFSPMPGLTAREQVAYAGWLKGLSRSVAWEAAAGALARVGLADEAGRLTAALSGGQQRRVGIASSLVHGADILLLDEPTVGLDPAQRARFREILAGVSPASAVVVATHQVDDLDQLFDRVVVLDRGAIVFDGTPARFLELAPASAAHRGEAAYAALLGSER